VSLAVDACGGCGYIAFPARALCPICGSSEWRTTQTTTGVVEQLTVRDEVPIATVRSIDGPRIVARCDAHVAIGDEVHLDGDGGVPTASRIHS